MGGIGIPEHEFWSMTLRGVYAAVRGYYERRREEDLSAWQRARLQTWILYRSLTGDKVQLVDFIPLDGDPEPMRRSGRLSLEEQLQLFGQYEKLADLYRKNNEIDKLNVLKANGKI